MEKFSISSSLPANEAALFEPHITGADHDRTTYRVLSEATSKSPSERVALPANLGGSWICRQFQGRQSSQRFFARGSAHFVRGAKADTHWRTFRLSKQGAAQIRQELNARYARGLPCGIPGIGVEMLGAIQQAAQPARQFITQVDCASVFSPSADSLNPPAATDDLARLGVTESAVPCRA